MVMPESSMISGNEKVSRPPHRYASPASTASSLTPLPESPRSSRLSSLPPSDRDEDIDEHENAIQARRTSRVRKAKTIYDPSEAEGRRPGKIARPARLDKSGASTDVKRPRATDQADSSHDVAAKRQKTKMRVEREPTGELIEVEYDHRDHIEAHQPSTSRATAAKARRQVGGTRAVNIPKDLLAGLWVPGDPVPQPLIREKDLHQHNSVISREVPEPVHATEDSCRPEKSQRPGLRICAEDVIGRDRRSVRPSGGISARKFAQVLRLVAGMAPPRRDRPDRRYQGPLPRPPVWAESRQELCETLPYYRAFQAGLYMNSRIAYGYLLEAFPAPRDIWAHSGRVVISHGGGQCVRTTDRFRAKGNPVLAADQTASDSRVDTLLNAYRNHTPVVLIAGEGYEALPFALGRAYAVLGWYWISYIWVEAEPADPGVTPHPARDYFHRYKVRFDWVSAQGRPWWDTFDGASRGYARVETKEVAFAHGLITPPYGGAESTQEDLKERHRDRPLTPVSPTPISSRPMSPTLLSDVEPNVDAHETSVPSARAAELAQSSKSDVRERAIPGTASLREHVERVDMGAPTNQGCSSQVCATCNESSSRVYREGWICFNHSCAQFWLIDTKVGLMPIPPGFALTYDDTWLRPTATPCDIGIPYDVRPPPPLDSSEGDLCAGDRSLWKGWACDHCGRANCRFRWELWECQTCGLTFSPLNINPVVGNGGNKEPSMPATILGNPVISSKSGISVSMRRMSSSAGTLITYDLPEDDCHIYHITFDETGFADRLWVAYQLAAAGDMGKGTMPLFQRRALSAHTSKGQLLSQQFAVNSGVKYKYIVDTLSLSFDESPSCVNEARDFITLAVEATLGDRIAFNEIMSVMYREGQKMNWHDDGEQGLGPVVASLSLGSSATMSWRAKGERNPTNTGYFHGRDTVKARSNPSTALSITLQHGDIMIMSGAMLQTLYHHRVVPHGYRVAATARVISPDGTTTNDHA